MNGERIVVIGGGIAGLAAAYELVQRGLGGAVTLIEAGPTLGGKIRTSPFHGLAAVDEGPDAFLARLPWAVGLARALGLGERLTAPATGSASIWHGELHPIPESLVMGVPSDLARLARSDLLSWRGKARAGIEPLLPATSTAPDSVGAFVRARFGDEVHELLVDPLVGSIYAADTDRFSLAAVPQLADLTGGRSLLWTARRRRRSVTAATGPVFQAPLDGMGALVAAVVDALAAGGVDVRMGRAVEHIQRRDGGFDVDGSPAAAVVLAAPARAAAPLVRGVCAEASDLLGAVGTASVAIVTVALPADQIDGELPGSGYLVPKPDQGSVTAVSFASNKWAHLRPDDGAHVLRISLGRDGLPVDDWTDDRLVEVAVSETERHLGPRCRTSLVPASVRVSRWPHAFPQYRPGHLERVERLQSILARDAPGLVVAGASHRGIGVPACIHQGRSAAGAIAARVTGVGDSAG